jgi:trans-aconitate methyltransferase
MTDPFEAEVEKQSKQFTESACNFDDFKIDWNNHARDETAKEPQPRPASQALIHILKDMEITFPCKVLDAGCGYGGWINTFLTLGCEVVGVDGAKEMVEAARSRFPELQIDHTNLRDIEYENEFDIVFTQTVLQHISPSEKLRVIQRLRNALHDDGFLVISEETFTHDNVKEMSKHGFLDVFFERYSNGGGYTVSGWIELVHGFGFDIQLYEHIPNNLTHIYIFKKV